MDEAEEEIELCRVIKESCSIISSWRKMFIQITLTLILPLSFLHLAHVQLSHALFMQNSFMLEDSPEAFGFRMNVFLPRDLVHFILFKIAYAVLFMIPAFLSASAVVYAVACVYAAKEITFRKVLTDVPRAWKRLTDTLPLEFVIVFAFSNAMGFLYAIMVCHWACVVAVLEERYDIQETYKIRERKMETILLVFRVLIAFFLVIQWIFEILVVQGRVKNGIESRIAYGFLALVLMSVLMLFWLVALTIICFIGTSFHHENSDKSSLANHLEGHLGEYGPLKSKDVQFHQSREEV